MLLTRRKNFLSVILSGCVLLTLLTTVRAQYQVQSWTTEEGLPQNTVHAIVQTPDGYLWLATLDGLVRYDGVKFTTFIKAHQRHRKQSLYPVDNGRER
jgi:ligand-binding sensor domain-containing protein